MKLLKTSQYNIDSEMSLLSITKPCELLPSYSSTVKVFWNIWTKMFCGWKKASNKPRNYITKCIA